MKRGFVAAIIGGLLCTPPMASAQTASDRWTFSLQPYLWLPQVSADLRYGPPPPGGASANVSIDPKDVLDALNFAVMLQGEARKGRWLIAGDLIYLDMGSERSELRSVDFNPGSGPINIATTQLNAGTRSSLDATVTTLVGGYNMINDATASLDLVAGFRYADVKVRTDWNLTADVTGPSGVQAFARSGGTERSTDLLDGIVGMRGRLKFADGKWFVPYHVDIGTGSSEFTWQGVLGAGYAFKWGDLVLAYRYLYFDEGDDKFVQKLSFGGFALGANFRF